VPLAAAALAAAGERQLARSRSPIRGLFPAVTLSFNLAPGASLSEAIAQLHEAEREIGLPEDDHRQPLRRRRRIRGVVTE